MPPATDPRLSPITQLTPPCITPKGCSRPSVTVNSADSLSPVMAVTRSPKLLSSFGSHLALISSTLRSGGNTLMDAPLESQRIEQLKQRAVKVVTFVQALDK